MIAPVPHPGQDDVTQRLDQWAKTLEDAVSRLNQTLAEIKELKTKEAPRWPTT